jgi:hypothetical protein
MRKEFLDYARSQLAKAEQVTEQWREVVAACEKVATTEIVHPPVDKSSTKRQRVDRAINEAVSKIPQQVEFTADTVFENFTQPGFDRNKTKVSISYRLSQMEKNGELKRTGWGVYVRL